MNPPRESPFHPLHNRTIVQPISVSLQRLAKYFYIVLVSLGIQVQVQLLKELKNYNYFSSQNSHKKMLFNLISQNFHKNQARSLEIIIHKYSHWGGCHGHTTS